MSESEVPLLPQGGYRQLRSYEIAQAVYDPGGLTGPTSLTIP